MDHTPNTHAHETASTTPSLPARDQALISELRNSDLEWLSSRTRDHRSWQSGGGSDPMSPDLDGFETRGGGVLPNFGMSRGRPHELTSLHRPLDWHTVEKETLHTSTGTHEITFSKTKVDSYSHQVCRGFEETFYDVEFVSLEDRNQTTGIRESTSPILAEAFAAIQSKARQQPTMSDKE